MVRDPLYRKIQERLGGPLDPVAFERCAVELLRSAYPGLAPITGGGDAGMDGAIPNETGGDPLPLIVTTAERVLTNLTRSLESYRRNGGQATQAVLATSQALTPRKRRNLEARAKDFGFTLRNVHDRADFTGRLYRDSKWRLELLGLPGDPPALSALPRLPGPPRAGPLVGRDEELAWLRGHRGDALLVGQPGVGKTALFTQLASEGHGLFAVSEDRGQIADAFRDNPVRFVFVDDGHLRESLLDLLIRLREAPGFDFGIVASTWRSHAEALARRLELRARRPDGRGGGDGLMDVGGLPRKTVADIIHREYPQLSRPVIGLILDQSENRLYEDSDDMPRVTDSVRPGLALTLARHTDFRGLHELVGGGLLIEGLVRDVRLSPKHLDCLATFALGGTAGTRQAEAARALNLPEVEVREALERLAGTGTIHDRRAAFPDGPAPRVVRPSALRHALVVRTFFAGGASLSLDPALECVEDAVACTEILLGALARGAAVPHKLIRARLEDHRRAGVGNRVLGLYAATGPEGAEWVLERYPDRAASVASTALRLSPERTLPRLLELSVAAGRGSCKEGDESVDPAGLRAIRPPRSEDIGAKIGDWVRAGHPGSSAFTRRRALLGALADGRGLARERPGIAGPLVEVCFSLDFMSLQGDPVDRESFGIPMGSLTKEDVQQLTELWPQALRLLRNMDDHGIHSVRRVVLQWLKGVRVPGSIPGAVEASRAEVGRMLRQALEVWEEPGFLRWARGLADEHGLDVKVPERGDPVLSRWMDTLYPPPAVHIRAGRRQDFKESVAETGKRMRRIETAARRVARDWCREEPATVLDRMLRVERQAEFGGHRDAGPMTLVAKNLAELVDEPSRWLEASANRRAPEAWVGSFLAAAVCADLSDDAPWRVLDRHDPHGEYNWVDLRIGIRLQDLPPLAVRRVVDSARKHAGSLRLAGVPWADVPDEWRIRLLEDRDAAVRGETAFALWDLHDRRPPPGDVGVAWRDAVVTCGGPELLHDVLRQDRDAANAWILHQAEESSRRKAEEDAGVDGPMEFPPSPDDRRIITEAIRRGLSERNTHYSLDTELLAAAAEAIRREDRRRLLRDISAEAAPCIVAYLVGDDPELEGIARERGWSEADLERDAC